MADKIIDKFDEKTLREIKGQLLQIQLWSTLHHRDKNSDLYAIIDGVCRVAHMYNMIIEQELKDKHVVTSDPQMYIQNKLSTPFEIHRRLKRKEEHSKS